MQRDNTQVQPTSSSSFARSMSEQVIQDPAQSHLVLAGLHAGDLDFLRQRFSVNGIYIEGRVLLCLFPGRPVHCDIMDWHAASVLQAPDRLPVTMSVWASQVIFRLFEADAGGDANKERRRRRFAGTLGRGIHLFLHVRQGRWITFGVAWCTSEWQLFVIDPHGEVGTDGRTVTGLAQQGDILTFSRLWTTLAMLAVEQDEGFDQDYEVQVRPILVHLPRIIDEAHCGPMCMCAHETIADRPDEFLTSLALQDQDR